MKKLMRIHIAVILFVLSLAGLRAQECDTVAVVRLTNVLPVQPDSLEFDIRLIRTSEAWDRWANGTFQFRLSGPTETTNPDSIDIELVPGTSQLKILPLPGPLPTESYYITPRIFDGRISVTVAGPEDYVSCNPVPRDTGLLIGTFRVASKKGSFLPISLDWLQPQYYYQSTAYKLQNDSLITPDLNWANQNDNIEMDDGCQTSTVRYEVDPGPKPEVILKYFYAEYVGQRKVALYWATEREAYNRGFILKRGIVSLATHDTDNVIFNHPVARYDGGTPEEDGMRGLGTRNFGKEYHYFYDTVEYRGEEYCYALYFQDFYGFEHYLAKACVKIPNSIIVYAQANPNPMAYQTTIEYKVDDDLYLTCGIYDILGKEVKKLVDKQFTKIGTHKLVFDAPRVEFATQGVYEAIFLAYPIDDPNVEISRAIVKIQVIR